MRMSTSSKWLKRFLLLGGQQARFSVSPPGATTATANHGATPAATAAPRLFPPLHRLGALVLLGPGRRPPAVPGRRGRRAPGRPGARDAAAGAVRHPAQLPGVAPSAGLLPEGLFAPGAVAPA